MLHINSASKVNVNAQFPSMNIAISLSIIKYRHESKLSLDETIEELLYSMDVKVTNPNLLILTVNTQQVPALMCKRLFSQLSTSFLQNSRHLPRELRIMVPICVKSIKTRTGGWEPFIHHSLLCIDSIFQNPLDPVNEVRVIAWYLNFIQTVLEGIGNHSVKTKFYRLFIQKVILKLYSVVVETIPFGENLHLQGFEQIVPQPCSINKLKVSMVLLLHINVILYVQEEQTMDDHLNVLSLLLRLGNEALLEYYQASTRFKV